MGINWPTSVPRSWLTKKQNGREKQEEMKQAKERDDECVWGEAREREMGFRV
jgi:hypothetical protein